MRQTAKYFVMWYMVFFLLVMVFPSQAKSSGILDSEWDLPQEEIDAGIAVGGKIAEYSGNAGYEVYSYYGTDETRDNIYLVASGCGHSYSIAWYHGHGSYAEWFHFWGWPWQWHWHQHFNIYTYDGQVVYDNDIYPHTQDRNVRFAFLYACHSGTWIGDYYPCGMIRGMPLAWLHTTDLAPFGYDEPDGKGYTFIGWNGLGPQLRIEVGGTAEAGKKFSIHFYYAALVLGKSIKAALDYAAYETWGAASFGVCIFRQGWSEFGGCMVVFGDGDLNIS